MTTNTPKTLLEQAKKADEELDYITDYLTQLSNERLETELGGRFETVSRFVWAIIDYLAKEEEKHGEKP